MRAFAGLLLALGLFSTPAGAATAFSLYTQGKYTQAVVAGVAQNDAAGFAVAARAEREAHEGDMEDGAVPHDRHRPHNIIRR